MIEQYSEVTNQAVNTSMKNKKKAPPSPGSNSEDGANDTIGRFRSVGLTSPQVSNLRYAATRSNNVAHLGGTILCAGHPLLIMIIILIVNVFLWKLTI